MGAVGAARHGVSDVVAYPIVLTLAVAACSGAAGPGPQEISLQAADIKYNETRLEVAEDQTVMLTLANIGALEHDFTVLQIAVKDQGGAAVSDPVMGHVADQADLHFSVRPGDTRVVEFTPTEAGRYEYFCSVVGHKEAGMVGTLVVKAP